MWVGGVCVSVCVCVAWWCVYVGGGEVGYVDEGVHLWCTLVRPLLFTNLSLRSSYFAPSPTPIHTPTLTHTKMNTFSVETTPPPPTHRPIFFKFYD